LRKSWLLAVFTVSLIVFSMGFPLHIPYTFAQTATFLGPPSYTPKIYDGDSEVFIFTISNGNPAETLFFLKIFRDGTVIYAESPAQAWPCATGGTAQRQVTILNWEGPKTYGLTAELYSSPSQTLQDTTTFAVVVVKLFVSNWSPLSPNIPVGKTSPTSLTVTFTNGGNDYMRNTIVSIANPSGMEVNPPSQALGDIPKGESRTTSFLVRAPETLSPSQYTLTFKIEYDDFKGGHHVETKPAPVNVVRQETRINVSVNPSTIKVGETVKITASLSSGDGDPVRGEEINFFLDSNLLGASVTDESGNAFFEFKVEEAGQFQVKATYSGSSRYDACSNAASLTVGRLSTTISLDIPNVASVGDQILINITLTDENGRAIGNQVIRIEANSTIIGEVTTEQNGKATVMYIPDRKGNLIISVAYEGSKNHDRSSTSKSLPVSPMKTALTLTSQGIAFKGSQILLSATFKDEKGNPIEGAVIDFYFRSSEGRIKIGSATTDKSGTASLSYTPDVSGIMGSLIFEAGYNGGPAYKEAQSSLGLTVIDLFTITALLILVIAGSIGLMVFFLRSRRKVKKPQVERKPVKAGVEHCKYCSAEVSEKDTFCPRCGKTLREGEVRVTTVTMPPTTLDEKVYNYIADHGGVISWKQAAKDLGVSVEELQAATERLKKSGKLEHETSAEKPKPD